MKAQATPFDLKRERDDRIMLVVAVVMTAAFMAGTTQVPKYWPSIEPVLASALSFIF